MYKLETSIDTKIVSLPNLIFSIKVIKSVVSLIKDCFFCATGTTRDDGSTNRFRSVDFCKCVEYWYSRRNGSLLRPFLSHVVNLLASV